MSSSSTWNPGGHERKPFIRNLSSLGTTKANAGSWEKFVKIDREYVIAAAKAARVEGLKQRLLYVSVHRNSSFSSGYMQS